jgi:hypothetical protein
MSSGMRAVLALVLVLVLVGSAEAFLGGKKKAVVEDEVLPRAPSAREQSLRLRDAGCGLLFRPFSAQIRVRAQPCSDWTSRFVCPCSLPGCDAYTVQAAALPPPPVTPLEIAMNPIDFVGRLVYKKMGGVNR